MSKQHRNSGTSAGETTADAVLETAEAAPEAIPEATPKATIDASMDAAIQAIGAASRKGGKSVERSHFRLDWSRALDKIKRFQLTDPHRYVLELVQAAVAGGASHIDVTTDSDDVIMRYDAPGHSADELLRLFDYLFAQTAELLSLRQLALGVNAALALEPKFILVDSGDGKRAHRLHLTSHADCTVTPLAGEDILAGTRVHVRERRSLQTLADFVLRRCAEAEHLAAACAFAPIPIVVDGSSVKKPLAPDALVSLPFHKGEIRGELALLPQSSHTAQLKVYMSGVEIATHELVDPKLPPLVGYVDCPALSRNASHTDVHRDDAYLQMLQTVKSAGKRLLRAWLRRRFGAAQSHAEEQTEPLEAAASIETTEKTSHAGGEAGAPALDAVQGATDEVYLRACARVFLRDRRPTLPPEVDAILDVPAMVELATTEPAMSTLRPIWERYRDRGTCEVADARYEVSLSVLPEGIMPVLSSSWLVKDVIEPSACVDVGELLRDYAAGMEKRLRAEALRRLPELLPSEAIVNVAVSSSAKHAIHGEVGLVPLTEAVAQWQRGLDVARKHNGQVRVIFLREGVPLGERVVTAPMTAVAVVESAEFMPTPAWNDVKDSRAVSAAMRLVSGAAGELAYALFAEIGELPPAPSLLGAGYFSAKGQGDKGRIPDALLNAWPRSAAALAARAHADEILARLRSLPEEPTSWLWQWPMLHTLTGEAVCLADIAGHGRSAPASAGPAEPAWGYVIGLPWGEGAPDDMRLLNVSREQKTLLKRLLPDLVDRTVDVIRHREALEKRARQEERRQQNLEAAALRRQEPILPEDAYAAVIDLAVPDGAGQAGIPRVALGSSPGGWIRVLVERLPLTDLPLAGPIPIHAVIESARYTADASFETVSPLDAIDEIRSLVLAHTSDLMAAFAASESAKTPPGYALIWKYLDTASTGEREPLKGVPKIIVDLPLVETVDRGRIPLRAVAADAAEHEGRVLVTDVSATTQLQKRPILRVSGDEQKTLRRLLGISLSIYTNALREELTALDKLHGRRQEPVITAATALKIAFADDTVRGEIAFPHLMSTGAARDEVNRVTVLHQGILLESRPLDIDGLPLMAVVESAAFQPNRTFSAVMRGSAWTRAQKALQNAASDLVVLACEQSHQPGFASLEASQVAEALRVLCGKKFLAKPTLQIADRVERALANARLWQTARLRAPYEGDESDERISLTEVSRQWQALGVVWVVGPEARGQVAPGRIIVRGGEETRDALTQIFGTAVQDGSQVLRRDDAAYQRRQSAPELSITVPVTKVMEPVIKVEQALPDLSLDIQGQVALRSAYADGDRGLVVEIGVDGRRLCERKIAHPLAGLGRLDCTGLTASRDWDSLGDSRQAAAIDACVSAALWQAALGRITAEGTAGELCASAPAAPHLAALITDALVALAGGRGRKGEKGQKSQERQEKTFGLAGPEIDSMREAALALPLFRTVQGQRISGRALVDHAAKHGRVLLVDSAAAGGIPADGRLIVQADARGLDALAVLLGNAAHRHDEEWARELAGQRRRRELPQTQPELGDSIAVSRQFSRGATSGMIGLLSPRPGAGRKASAILDDHADPPSRVRVHIDRRYVCDRTVTVHPAVEIWLNDDRLTPSADFQDIATDAVYEEALAAALAELPELLARAAESCAGAEDMRLRLCHYALSRRDVLAERAAGRPRSPEARLLAAPLWACLTEEGERIMTTAEIAYAHTAGELVTLDRESRGHTAGSGVIAVRACPRTREILLATLGDIRDVSRAVLAMEARRIFLGRPPVAAIRVEEAFPTARPLWRHALIEPGWEGEVVIPDQPGHNIEIAVFVDHRPFMTTRITAPMEALVAVQWSGLTVGPNWDHIERDAAFAEFTAAIRRAACAAYAELARGIAQLSAPRRRRAALIILDTLAAAAGASADPALRRMVDALLKTPVITMTTGEIWPVAAIRDAHKGKPLAVVTPETAAQGKSLTERVVAVCDEDIQHWLAELVRIEAYDQAYLVGVRAYERRERAETSYKRPRSVIAAAELGPSAPSSPSDRSGRSDRSTLAALGSDEVDTLALGFPEGTSGWMALSTDIRAERVEAMGELALFSRGRLVERRQIPCPGLVGYLDGPFVTDPAFTAVMLEPAHERAFRQIYRRKLAMAVELARPQEGGTKSSSPAWHALRAYVLLYIQSHLGELSTALADQRDPARIGEREGAGQGATKTLRMALACPVLALGDGTYADLATVLSAAGERPIVLVTSRARRAPTDALFIIAEPESLEQAVLTALLGKRRVLAEDEWRTRSAEVSPQVQRGRKQGGRNGRAGAPTLDDEHVLAALKSALREIARQAPVVGFGQPEIAAITCLDRGASDLIAEASAPPTAEDGARGAVMSTSHPAWEAVRTRIRHDPRAIWHLAAAFVAEFSARSAGVAADGTIALLGAIAEHLAEAP